MFKKILIANRGEIAIRIMRTCREMHVCTVAVYSEADRYALHTQQADEAYFIGPSVATQSYLRIDALIAIAKQAGAEAIHPGYGFLAENADFADACEQAGIVFIGPPASAMRLMGSKIAAKQLAQSVGAPTIPGYNGESQDAGVLLQEAMRVGFPLLIKASAGGGGKGMREVNGPDDFAAQLAGAQREALAAFGDNTVLLERLVLQPRHVEIQVLGDMYGNLIHLGERECSIQRRHQKIVEESPSVALTPTLRSEMGAAAVRIARAAGYTNAGTMEFIFDSDKRFYFLEMNTRLQVEHPVTELVTGLDLVRHQLRISSGEPLTIRQEEISPRGHAIEVRLYAEDPEQNFLPSTGTITRFIAPTGPGTRVDSGVESGNEITQFYDPMIAKIIVYAEDRLASIERMQRALEQTAVFGVKTNASLLASIIAHPAFQDGFTHTSFLLEHELVSASPAQITTLLPDDVLLCAALYDLTGNRQKGTVYDNAHGNAATRSPWQTLGPWRMIGEARRITYTYQDQDYTVGLRQALPEYDGWHMQINERDVGEVACAFGNDGLILLRREAQQVHTYTQRLDNSTEVNLCGHIYRLKRRQPPNVDSAAQGASAGSTQKILTTPMAGTIVKVQVREGEKVEQRQALVILSAMKMEHTIAAPYTGKVRRIHYTEGSVVKGGVPIIEME